MRAYYSSFPHSPVRNAFLAWSFIRTCWRLSSALWEGAFGFTDLYFSLADCFKYGYEERDIQSVRGNRHNELCSLKLCSESFCYFMCNHYLGLGLYNTSWWGCYKNVCCFHYFILSEFLWCSSPSFLIMVCRIPHRVRRCQGNGPCS